MKKKTTAIALIVALLAIAVAGGTLAYFSDSDSKTNEFTVGSVDIAVSETEWDRAVEEELNENMYPGQTIDKNPVVTNNGENPSFVRIKVTGLDQFGENAPIKVLTAGKEGVSADWTYSNGYYYYMKELAPEASTAALFEQFQLPTSLTNKQETQPIVIQAQAVQSQGFTGDKTKAEDLAAWFTTCLGE